jgi:hypothetical protein
MVSLRPTLRGMTLIIGLAFITLLLLAYGHGLLAALGLWGMAVAYVLVNPMPNMTFAMWLSVAGLAAFVIQLALGLKPEEKKK